MSLNKRLFTGGPLPGATLENAFQTVLWTGNGSTQSISGVGFQPDLVWIKHRDGTNPHGIWDSTRGAGPFVQSHSTDAQTGNSGNLLGSFDSDGFQVNRNYLSYTAHDNTNGNGNPEYVGWCWRANGGSTSTNTDGSINSTVQANTDAGFSIIQYTGSGNASSTVGHGLTGIPRLILAKSTTWTNSFLVYMHDGTDYWHGYLNDNGALNKNSSNTQVGTSGDLPTSSVIETSHIGTNNSSQTFMMWAWEPIPGYSKFGSYTGNGSTTGPTVTLGFAPGLLILRKVGGDRWIMADNKRDTSNPNDKFLDAQDTHQESTLGLTGGVDFLSDGFQLKTTDGGGNANNEEYIYLAWREAS